MCLCTYNISFLRKSCIIGDYFRCQPLDNQLNFIVLSLLDVVVAHIYTLREVIVGHFDYKPLINPFKGRLSGAKL